MLNDLAGIDVQSFVGPDDDFAAGGITLVEHLELCIQAIMKVVSRGVSSSGGSARVAILEAGFRKGLQARRRHSNECRSLMRIDGNYKTVADIIDVNLRQWSGQLSTESSAFAGRYIAPPGIGEFSNVVVPEWTRRLAYIGAGGLRNSHIQPRQTSSSAGRGRGRSTTSEASDGRTKYCWAWAAGTCGRSARDCQWLHEHDPNKSKTKGGRGRTGGGRRGRGGGNSNGGGASRNGDSSGSGSGGGGGDGGSSGGGGGSGGGSSSRT